MNEKELKKLMQNIDNDLIEKELDSLMEDIEIDMDSVSKKANKKLKESVKMKKRKRYSIIAAALVSVIGVSGVIYASEISEFVKSFTNKKQIYSTVVEGDAFYLKSPVQLDENNKIEKLIFTKDVLEMKLITDMKIDKVSDSNISISSNNVVYLPGGYSINGENNLFLSFYNEANQDYVFSPASELTLTIGQKSYDIKLSEGETVISQGEILAARSAPTEAASQGHSNIEESVEIDWLNVGYKQIENGVQILTSFLDKELRLIAIGEPLQKSVESMIDYEKGLGTTTSISTNPLFGYDKEQNSYEFTWDRSATGRPVTIFNSDAPADKEIELKIPSLIVGYKSDKNFPKFKIDMPNLNEKIELDKEIDFNLQKMIFKSIERKSETTAELVFELNTGDKKEVSIRDANISCEDIKKVECLWADNICTIQITFDKDLKNMDFGFNRPEFVVTGNWSLALNQ